ncbi:cell division protein FtsI/penicillin-binding protein 2, partial [Deinococcus humi]|nr:cell division protein FtsI/penicillin-binding protein 2 [Deinococcus humi]
MSRAEHPLHRPDQRHERLKRERKRAVRVKKEGASSGAARVGWVAFAFSLGLLGLGVRLYTLQVTQHSQYAVQSASNFQRDEVIRALRGEIR